MDFGLLRLTKDDSGLPTGPLITNYHISLIMVSLNMLDLSMFSFLLSICFFRDSRESKFLGTWTRACQFINSQMMLNLAALLHFTYPPARSPAPAG